MRFILSSLFGMGFTALSCLPAQALDVYFLRGAGDLSQINPNMHFSHGLDEMAGILAQEGLKTKVFRFTQVNTALREIRRERPKSLALVGHSMGAAMSMRIVKELRKEGIRVAYLATLDIPGPMGLVEDNVDRADNFYTVNPVFAKITRASENTRIRNISMFGTIHNRMDDTTLVKSSVLAALREIHAEEQRQLFEDQLTVDPLVDERQADLGATQPGSNVYVSEDATTKPLPLDQAQTAAITNPQTALSYGDQGYTTEPLASPAATIEFNDTKQLQTDGLPQSQDPLLLQQSSSHSLSQPSLQPVSNAPVPGIGVGEQFAEGAVSQAGELASSYAPQAIEPGPEVKKWRRLFKDSGQGASR